MLFGILNTKELWQLGFGLWLPNFFILFRKKNNKPNHNTLAKILYVWKGEYPWDVRVEKICKAMIKAGHRVILLCRWGEEQPNRESIAQIEIVRVGYKLARYKSTPISQNPLWRRAINKAIEEFQPELIIPREILLADACAKFARKNQIPILMDMAENYPAAMKEWKKYRKTLFRRLLVHHSNIPEHIEKRCVPKMDGIITVCFEQNERLNHNYCFPFEKMQVVHNVPELEFFEGIRKGSSSPPKIFLHHGNMTQEKSLELLINGFILAAKNNKEIKLILSGAGETFEELVALANKSDVKDRIIFKGKYQYYELREILSEADIGVIPYKINDFNNHTIHNKVFDFLAAGKPVICTSMKPLKRLINKTGTGIILNSQTPRAMAEAIEKMINMDIKTFSNNGLIAAKEKYNWTMESELFLNFINKFL